MSSRTARVLNWTAPTTAVKCQRRKDQEKMKAKTFVRNLSECIFKEYEDEIPQDQLKSSFVEAIKNISAGKLKDDLNTNFDKHLEKLEKYLKSLCVRDLPSVSSVVDDSLEELTKSELGGRTEVEEHSTKHVQKVLYNLMERDLKKPKVELMKLLDKQQRYIVYRTYIQKLLYIERISDTFITKVITDFDELCGISKKKKAGKSKFDWFPKCNLLLQLATGSRPLAYIRVLKLLFDAIQNDVNKCLANKKASRAEDLCEVLKKFFTVCRLGVDHNKLQDEEAKKYCRYMSALLSFYVDLCCVCSRNIEKKKVFGRELAGYVCYILQHWPESLLEVALQLQGLEDANYNILLPLINKCLEKKPPATDNVCYLKYVLLVRQVKDVYGEYEQIEEWNLATKMIPASADFLDWLGEECPEALEHMPVEDKNFMKTKITRFLLEEVEDDLITILLSSLSTDDEEAGDEQKNDEVPASREITIDATMETENLFYLDMAGESTALDLADDDSTQVPASLQQSKKTESPKNEVTKERRSKKHPIILKTLEEIQQLVDTELQAEDSSSPQTYTLDPQFVMEKVVDPEDRKFLQTEIISITSMSSISQSEETLVDTEDSEDTLGKEDTTTDSGSSKSGKWIGSSSSTPNKKRKRNRNRKSRNKQETDNSCVSEIEKTEDFADSVTSASEDDRKVKSVVRKVTPRKTKDNSPKSPSNNKFMSELCVGNLQENKANSIPGKLASKIQGVADGTVNETEKMSDNVICIDSDDNDLQTEFSSNTDNTKLTADENETLSSVHESSAEIVNIILESAEKSENHPDNETSRGKPSVSPGIKRDSSAKRESPRKRETSKSPRKKLLIKSPISINSSQVDESTEPENNLSCMSNLTTATSLTDMSSANQNSTLKESELDNTVKYTAEKNEAHSERSDSDSDILSDRPRRLSRKSSASNGNGDCKDEKQKASGSDDPTVRQKPSRKSSSGSARSEPSVTGEKTPDSGSDGPGKQRKSSKKRSLDEGKNKHGGSDEQQKVCPKKGHSRVSEMPTEDESDGNVFEKSPEKSSRMKLGAKDTASIEEKFIDKAIKGRKPRKSKGQGGLHQTLEISGSVSLFPDEDASQSAIDSEASSGQRTKSTEDIIQIVEEIKEKIKSPIRGKTVTKSKEKLDESMFTDESIESLENEANIKGRKVNPAGSLKSPTVPSPSKKNATTGSQKKTPSKHGIGISGPSEKNQDNAEVIDLIEEETDPQKHNSEEKNKKGTITEISEIKLTETDIDISCDSTKRSKILSPKNTDRSPSPKKSPMRMKGQRSHSKARCDVCEEFTSPSRANKSNTDMKANGSPGIKEVRETKNKTNMVVGTSPSRKDSSHNCDQISLDSENEADGKSNAKVVTDSDTETGVISKENYVMTDSETETEKANLKNRTPKRQLEENDSRSELSTKKRTPKSASKVDKIEQKEITKTPEGQTAKSVTPKSDSKSTSQNTKSPRKLLSPNIDKLKSSPTKNKSATKEQSPQVSHKDAEKPSGEELIPSSKKKPRRRSSGKGSDRTKDTIVLSSSIESEGEVNPLPDIGVHLKTETSKMETVSGKSPLLPPNTEANSSLKRSNESTPQRKNRQSQKTQPSPESPASVTGQDTASKRKQTRNKAAAEPVGEPVETESDVDGPTTVKRLRSATKTAPESAGAKSAAVKGRVTKTNSGKSYGSHSDTDATSDVSDFEPRRTRKSMGARKIAAVKDKIPEAVDEEPDKVNSTPPGKIIRQKKISASTTKKAVKKLEELRGTRKRRLSAELSDQSSVGNMSSDSEVSFPKTKPVAASEKKSSRLSTQAMQTQKESPKDTTGKRYSLRKK